MITAEQTSIGIVTEEEWGVTPATPVFQKLRYTNDTIGFTPESVQPKEIAGRRDVMDNVVVSGGSAGGLSFELSYGTFDELFESLLFNTWSEGNELINGETLKSFTIERKYGGAKPGFYRYTGMVCNGMELAFNSGEIVTGSFDFLGKGGSTGEEIIMGATYTEATTTPVLSGAAHIEGLTVGDISPDVLNLSISIQNNLNPANVLGSKETAGIAPGKFVVTGSIDMYFDDIKAYQAFLAETPSKIAFTIGTASTQKYKIELPKIKFTQAETGVPGENEYMINSYNFQALYDTPTAGTIKITRAVA